jgi:hypothetical protein
MLCTLKDIHKDDKYSTYQIGNTWWSLVSMVKRKWILQLCWKCFYNGRHMTLECGDTKLWPVSGCIPMSLSTLKGRKTNGRAAAIRFFITQRLKSLTRPYHCTLLRAPTAAPVLLLISSPTSGCCCCCCC